jgi:hypothetical protein
MPPRASCWRRDGALRTSRRRRPLPSTAPGRTTAKTSDTRPSAPTGISVVNGESSDRIGKPFDTSDPVHNAYANPDTAGITFRTAWADIEPESGQYDFSKLDAVFDNAEAHGKWVMLILIPGFGTPAWALQGVKTGTFDIQYGPGAAKASPMALAVPWDGTYLSRWFAFLKVIAMRYGDRPSFREIAAAGPTSVSAEMSLPDADADVAQWKKLGYTEQAYVDAWKQTFTAYATTFPKQMFSLSLHPALPLPQESDRTTGRDQVIALGVKYPKQFALQEDGLNGNRGDTGYGYTEVLAHSGQIATGFMMSTSATQHPDKEGSSSDAVKSLTMAIDMALTRSSAGASVDYVEIYEPDALNPAMHPLLQSTEQKLTAPGKR